MSGERDPASDKDRTLCRRGNERQPSLYDLRLDELAVIETALLFRARFRNRRRCKRRRYAPPKTRKITI